MSSSRKQRVTKARTTPRIRPGKEGGVRATNRHLKAKTLVHAAQALFLKHGIDAVTIDEIALSARMAKGSFYRYFKDKDAVVVEVFREISEALQSAFERCRLGLSRAESASEMTSAYLELAAALTAIVGTHPNEVRLYLQECNSPASGARKAVSKLAHRIDDNAVRLTEAAHARGLLKPFDARITALAVVGATQKLLHAHLSGGDVGPAEQIPGTLVALVLQGIRG